MGSMNGEPSILDKLDSMGEPLKQFDAFPKIPTTYKSTRGEGGLLTLFAVLLSILLVLNDVGEYIWGWSDYEFSVDRSRSSYMPINVDLVVNMPCHYLSVDIRDAVGDRLHLSDGLKREGTVWDVGQASRMQNHSETMLSATEVVRESRKSRGFFSIFRRNKKPDFKPTYHHPNMGKAVGSACRIFGSMFVKKVTANLHITTAGHGYSSHVHTDHTMMNLSHVVSEFSFGPFIPDISQPLDNLFEVAREPFTAYQYFLTVVPTTYVAPRAYPMRTNQYSVTNYKRTFEHGQATPGIFFKFDIDPMQLTILQRTTTFTQLLIRIIGVVGGVWVCMGWAVKIGYRAAEAVIGPSDDGYVVAESSAVQKKRWVGGELRARPNARVGGANGSPYSSYQGTPTSAAFAPTTPGTAQYARVPLPPSAGYASPGFPQSAGYASPGFPRSNASVFPPSPLPGASGFPTSPLPGSAGFPPSPSPGVTGFPRSPGPQQGLGFAQHQVRTSSGLRVSSSGEEIDSPYTPPPPKKEKSD
ncbi:DUF1692-domain-containing protein [Exidia glandulosa HHB12029]|uniref:DUF1692-domain-containing protein n=1 Tax=Exidia glandulosa HHB12029 TaxID=1314781 RepID=A0A165GZZ6_EXIGL|nr:DUF1692-domain-containing protein [Exidia glandulosa HHB12029]